MRQVPEDAVFADMAEARRFNEMMRKNEHWQEECQELAQKVVDAKMKGDDSNKMFDDIAGSSQKNG